MTDHQDDLSAALTDAMGRLSRPSNEADIELRLAALEAYQDALYEYLVELVRTPLDQQLPQSRSPK